MTVLDGRRESCSSKTNSSNWLLFKQAVTVVCLCPFAAALLAKANSLICPLTCEQIRLFVFVRQSGSLHISIGKEISLKPGLLGWEHLPVNRRQGVSLSGKHPRQQANATLYPLSVSLSSPTSPHPVSPSHSLHLTSFSQARLIR